MDRQRHALRFPADIELWISLLADEIGVICGLFRVHLDRVSEPASYQRVSAMMVP
jgi:hypothetical protein